MILCNLFIVFYFFFQPLALFLFAFELFVVAVGIVFTVSIFSIFNKFYQGDSSHESEGNGLGLALVRKIIAIHGGDVWLEDPASGGFRFAVRLPMET